MTQIKTELDRITSNIKNAYDQLKNLGVTIATTDNSNNLATRISLIKMLKSLSQVPTNVSYDATYVKPKNVSGTQIVTINE